MATRYSKDKLLRDVRVIIAENEQLDPLIEMEDTMALERDTLLKTLVPIAIDKIHAIAPVEMLTDIAVDLKALDWKNTDVSSKIAELPDDFLRLVYVKAKNWRKGVIDVVDEESDEYMDMHSPMDVERPTIYDPVAAVTKSSFTEGEGRGGNFVEISPIGDDVIVRYIPKTLDDSGNGEGGDEDVENDGLLIAGECYWCIVYTIANLYFVSVNDNGRAEMMAKEAADVIQSYKDKVSKK